MKRDINLISKHKIVLSNVLDGLALKGFDVDIAYSMMVLMLDSKLMITVYPNNTACVHTRNGIEDNDINYNLDTDPLLTEILLG